MENNNFGNTETNMQELNHIKKSLEKILNEFWNEIDSLEEVNNKQIQRYREKLKNKVAYELKLSISRIDTALFYLTDDDE